MTDQILSDRERMLKAEQEINEVLAALNTDQPMDRDALRRKVMTARNAVHQAAHGKIDYQIVVDNLDSNVLIADAEGRVLYMNKAYEKHTNVPRDVMLGARISDIQKTHKYFSAPVVPDVIRTLQPVVKLSYFQGNTKPGIVFGVPIFDRENNLQYVVASNRGIPSFTELNENFREFVDLLDNAYQNTQSVRIYHTAADNENEQEMVGQSEAMQHIHTFVKNLSKTDATVLITGESGTGKELVANAIYKNSSRADKPFIKINCSSIPEHLLESELFGYEKGAFSGANAQGKTGLFEAANNGTLLLDEIGDMHLDLQAKLLRAIQSNEITRVGGTKPIHLNVRFIASTNSDLKQKIKEGTFRSDLYYRLHVIPINIPPLRNRKEDIPLLCDSYLKLFSGKYNAKVSLSQENYEALMHYSWPGNIRELRNVMEYLTVCCSDLPEIDNSMLYGIFNPDEDMESSVDAEPASLSEAVSAYEKDYLQKALKNVRNLKEASELLQVDISTVSRKLKHYGLSIKK